ncbi:conserved Plasmodium protein, unknown function [Plasmodium berghei]|uniref:Uncharacterized protein n=2 Tax=Plasmodium berghei TaxID=5821 RepID=A0A509AN61_PLABA|nr:conserved Plasmodium protein, unknown function [Plasmodium berghei ANKA]CXI72487.1 conserved Plasmodium protein, unknown function [Plasmodium berghei]SCM24414.1 conserved Plasmodium protein, unknown function [Plasmodium berghei]SCN27056.1 conserved Plasmodium protein, unknown function [Plasmodium berghei]SCO61534.1 conserved Plasmodium protein, unknown function [Plasmodium berghei]SCO63478.1 conserved Plasmodium protein, unknown function [Plasmodium berghei]|eukprot:XP_034422690.1 conserved Plasmodium protein, unknown function [Plasmodium berghei ANKA]
MSQLNNKILKVKIEGVKSGDLDLFKSLLIPFDATFEECNPEEESIIVQFKKAIEKQHLDVLGNYNIKPITFESNEDNNQQLRKRKSNLICDRIIVDDHDIIKFFMKTTIIIPVIFVLLSLLVLFSIF